MKLRSLSFVGRALCCGSLLCACMVPTEARPGVRPEAEPRPVLPEAGVRSDALAVQLFADLAQSEPGNVVFSPASLEKVLRLLQRGAQGETRAVFDALPMGREGVPSTMQVRSADALFADETFELRMSAEQVMRVSFAARPEEAVNTINSWCSEQTEGRIPAVLTRADVSADTALIAANAVYLREQWLHPFEPDATRQGVPFALPGGGTAEVDMMSRTDVFRYAEGEDWQAVALFYRTDGRSGEPGCWIGILPKGAARPFAQKMTAEQFSAIRAALAAAPLRHVQVDLPKISVQTPAFSLRNALCTAGLQAAFAPEADYSGIGRSPRGKLSLSNVMQRCMVELSEKETVAAAVTMAMVTCCAMRPEPMPHIRFDRPFLWAIGDLTTEAPPYFLGLFERPE
ncbi:MAG: serpin family protein [Akkermansia sp.]